MNSNYPRLKFIPGLFFLFLVMTTKIFSQVNTTNTGVFFISSSTVTSFEGSFTNTVTGNSANNGLIYLKGDWTNDGSFTSTGSEEFWGNSVQTISGNSVTSFFDLIIDKPANQVKLNQNTIALNRLILNNGPLDLNSKIITIANPAITSIGYTNGYIISEKADNSSKVMWNIGSYAGNHIIPFADISGTLIPLELNLTSGDIGTVTTSTYPTNPSNIPLPILPFPVTNLVNYSGMNNSANTVDRFWQVDNTGPSGIMTIAFSYTDIEIPANGELFLAAQRYETSNDKWQPSTPSQTPDFANNRVIAPNLSQFGPFTLALTSEPLPIELLYFNVSLSNNNQTDILWTTSSEINNAFFTVEKSGDAIHFEKLKIIDGAGNSNTIINYRTIDEHPFQGITFYRLRQTDFNGAFTYSEIKSVFVDKGQQGILIYPNPVINKLTIRIDPPFYGILKLTDAIGKTLFYSNYSSDESNSMISIPFDNLAAGTYILNFYNNKNSTIDSRLIIKE